MSAHDHMLPQRRSIRIKDYDYSSVGCYFVTICTQNRECLFGHINSVGVDPCVDPTMALNEAGRLVNNWWKKLPEKFPNIELDIYQIMPNHLHGIIGVTNGIGRTHGSAPTTLGTIIQWFKTMSTNEYIRNVKSNHWKSFNNRLWQRNYYEHVIRNDDDLSRIREYITNNPLQWELDEENPKNIKKRLFLFDPKIKRN